MPGHAINEYSEPNDDELSKNQALKYTRELAALHKKFDYHKEHLEELVEKRAIQLQAAQEHRVHSEELSAISKLCGAIAHEFNSPLYGIRNVLEQFQENISIDEKNKSSLKLAIKECNRIALQIRKLQDFYKPSYQIETWIDIHAIIDEMMFLFERSLKDRKIILEKHYVPNLPRIKGVEEQIKRVFLNLVQNAEEAIDHEGGKIIITTHDLRTHIEIHIQDTGKGIPPDKIKLIFNPFFTTKSAVKEVGLGLSVSYGIIKKHGGSIKVASHPGKETTFIVTLPV